MKVLITGGYGFIGSHVAERFNKEGHQVYIIDNLSTGRRQNVSFKHRSYKYDIQDKRCSEIFRNNKFDIVIHMAAQGGKVQAEDYSTNISGLVNMLQLSKEHNVKRFIFASTFTVYGKNMNLPLKEDYLCDPISPFGISKYAEELYCSKWYEIYGLNTLCLRMSVVYGPREGASDEGGKVSSFIKKALSREAIELSGDGNQTRDYIYVEDVADAVYKSIDSGFNGVLNLSSNCETSENKLIETLKGLLPITDVTYKKTPPEDILRSCLDNTLAKEELDWVPLYSLEKGVEKTIRWHMKNVDKAREEVAVAKDVAKISLLPVYLPYIENILAFVLVLLLTNITRYNADFRVFDFRLLYIILMGIMYGTRQSTISVALSTILYISTSLSIGRDPVSLIYDPNSLLQISIYILVGLAVGYTIDRKNRDIQFREMRLKSSEEKYAFMNEMYNETRLVKEELQNQIVNSEDSFGKIYSIIKEIDSLQPEDIFNTSVGVLEGVMKSNTISIYTVSKNGQFLRLAACSKDINKNIPKSLRVGDSQEIASMMAGGEVFINREINPNLPMIMAPIKDNSKVIAVVSIHNVQFENFTLYYHNLFSIVAGLISASLSKAYRYEEATCSARYINDTRILTYQNFVKILNSKRQAKRSLNINYTVLYLGKPEANIQELYHELSNAVRETDYIGAGKSGNLYVLLSNTGKSDAQIVIKRLEGMGIAAIIMEQENEDE